MKKILLILFTLVSLMAEAGITTYEFTSTNWGSRSGTITCDGTTDGWTCNMAASEVGSARTNATGELMYAGVGVKTSTSGAGATSVKTFTDVRQLTFNFCQNSSKGKGVIYVQIGNHPADSIVVNRPATSGTGVYNRDSIIRLHTPLSGQIRFWVNCSENGIYIHSLSIRAAEGGTNPFTTATYQLVTNISELAEMTNQIIIGVPSAGRIMGYFDETISQNNIHAINGTFAADGSEVSPRDEAIYTLERATDINTPNCYFIKDELRYEEAYLVASGGQTKNRLALWDKPTDANTYGAYGYWQISIADNGDATIHNLGNSRSTYLQYNASNNPTLFSCYAQQGSQTAVKIYRRVEAIGDVEAILAPIVNFGTLLQENDQPISAKRDVTIQANRLTEDIHATINNPVFSLSDSIIDRDGDNLRITCNATIAGHYTATLTLTSGNISTTANVMATVVSPLTVAEAVVLPDYSMAYLREVEVTKKFDKYIFVRDETGNMLIYDNGDGVSGTRYGTGLKSGDKLTLAAGRMQNYYGVPEMAPTTAFHTTTSSTPAAPEEINRALDSADVCRFVSLKSVEISNDMKLQWQGQELSVVDQFNIGVTKLMLEDITAIVMISWDELQLWPVNETPITNALEDVVCPQGSKRMVDGMIVIENNEMQFNTDGKRLK